MADGGNLIRRHVEAPERIEYGQALERIANFVDNELGNGRAPGRRPDDTQWRIQRAKTIRTINELREKLDSVCVGANYGKAVGNGAEIIGAVGAVGGAIMCLSGIPSGQTVLNIGNLVQNTGTLIDGVSNVVESLVSANYLNGIEAVLKVDQELSQPLAQWLNFSRELDANIVAIFGVSLADEKLQNIMKIYYEFSKFTTSARGFNATVTLMKQGEYSLYIGNDIKLERLQKFFQTLSGCPQLADRVRVALSVLSVSTGAFQVYRDGARAYRSVMGISTSVVAQSHTPEIPTPGQVSTFCVFQAISMALSVISLINAASVIRHGKSKYSDALKELTRCLAWELTRMEDL